MKTETFPMVLLLIALPVVGIAAQPKLSCIKDITYNSEFLRQHPNAPAACREVVIRNGQKWARFESNVTKVEADNVTVDVLDEFNNTIATVTFKASPDARVTINGSPAKFSSLQSGQKLTFWVPDNVEGLYASPSASHATKLALVEREEKQVR